MKDLKQFRKANNLKQAELAEFLGVSRAFIAMVETGKTKMPTDKERRILNNPKGWKTDMIVGDNIEQIGGQNNIGKISGDCIEILALKKEVEMLREQLAKAEAQNNRYWEIIEKLIAR